MNGTLSDLEKNLYSKDGFYHAYRNLNFKKIDDDDATHLVNLISHHLASLYDDGFYTKEDKKRVKSYFKALKKVNVIDNRSYREYEQQLKTYLNAPRSMNEVRMKKSYRIKTLLYSAFSGIGGVIGGYAMSLNHHQLSSQLYSAFNYAYTSLSNVVNELFNHFMH